MSTITFIMKTLHKQYNCTKLTNKIPCFWHKILRKYIGKISLWLGLENGNGNGNYIENSQFVFDTVKLAHKIFWIKVIERWYAANFCHSK